MAKNKIQFQRGLSLTQFFSRYSTERKCYRALFRLRWPDGFKCTECGYHGYCFISSRKVYQIHRCHFQRSVISDTIFSSYRVATDNPVPWHLPYYPVQRRNILTPERLKK